MSEFKRTKPAPVDPRAALSASRRATGAESLAAFARTYLPQYFKAAPSSMHEELFVELERFRSERGLRMAVAAPRSHAKSTLITLAFALWCVVYEREPFIVIVSDTASQAQDHLAHLKQELESNERLAEDFPHLCGSSRGVKWKKDDLITRATDARPNGMRVLAMGAGQKIRGRRNRSDRPSLIIVDDLENTDDVRNPELRAQLADWFFGTLMRAGSVDASTLVVGTVLHHDSLLSRLLDRSKTAGWIRKSYRAIVSWADRGDLWETWESIYNRAQSYQNAEGPEAAARYYRDHRAAMDAGARALWPQQVSYEQLMIFRVRDGRNNFSVEMLNEPCNPESLVFAESDFHFWDDPVSGIASDPTQLIQKLNDDGYLDITMALDPSLGRTQHGDFTALVVVGRHRRSECIFVLHADIRRVRAADIVNFVMEQHRLWRPSTLCVESVQFQQLLADQIRNAMYEDPRPARIREMDQTQNKVARIQSIAPLMAAGRVKLSRRQTALLEQLRSFPTGSYDDGPDALEMAIRAANREEGYAVGWGS